MTRLHLGCGHRIIPGYDNLDGEPIPGAIKWWAPKLPYESNSVDFIYSEHFIEHLTKDVAIELFKECKRVLSVDGKMRISTPNLVTIERDRYSGDFRTKYSPIGWNPKTESDFFNEAMRSWGHQYLWYPWDLGNEISLAFGQFSYVALYDQQIESRPDFGDCIIEVVKK